MTIPDLLSRRRDLTPPEGEGDILTTLLPDSLFVQTLDIGPTDQYSLELRNIDLQLRKEFQDCHNRESIVEEALAHLTRIPTQHSKQTYKEWELDDGLIFYHGRCYVPMKEELRRKIVRDFHDSTSTGHPGQHKTLQLVSQAYWWPRMTQFINRYVDGCATCQQNKVITHPVKVPLLPLAPASDPRPFAQISVDLIVKLPPSLGYDSILTIVDQGLSKAALFVPCKESTDALGISHLLVKYVYSKYGLYDAIISDQGPQFASQVTKELYKLLGIQQKLSTAYHPQTDGQTERVNQELEIYLRIFTANQQDQWANWLHLAEFTHNNRPHSSKGTSPFFILMGYQPHMFPMVFHNSPTPALDQRLKIIHKAREEAIAAHVNTQQMMRERFKGHSVTFKIGDKILLDATHLRISHGNKKLHPKRIGPLRIVKVINSHAYEVALPALWKGKVHPVFHITRLTPYRETEEHGPNYSTPIPDIVEGEEEWEIEQIIHHRTNRRGLQFLVTWKGYPASENQWLPSTAFKHAQTILKDYKTKHKLQ